MGSKWVSAEGSQAGIKIRGGKRKRRDVQLEIPSCFMGVNGKRRCFWVLAGLRSLRPRSLWSVPPLRCLPPRRLWLGWLRGEQRGGWDAAGAEGWTG